MRYIRTAPTGSGSWGFFLRGEAKPHDANEHETADQIDQCLFKEAGKSESRCGAAFCILQLLQDSPELAGYSGDGSRSYE